MRRYSEQSVVIIATFTLCAVGWLLTINPTPSAESSQEVARDRQFIRYEVNSAVYDSVEKSLLLNFPGVVINQSGPQSRTRIYVGVTLAERRQVDAIVRKHDPAAESEVLVLEK